MDEATIYLVASVARRAAVLADKELAYLRSSYPLMTASRSELIGECKKLRLTRGQLIEAILLDEFLD